MSITKFDGVLTIEGYIGQWMKHLVLAINHVFELEHRLCNDVFKKIGSEVATILSLLQKNFRCNRAFFL